MTQAFQQTSKRSHLVKSVSGTALAILASLGLMACESGSSTDGAPAGNNSPVVTSSADDITVPENTTGPIYTFTATDADGDALTLALSSSSDFNDFTFDADTGELSFAEAPDHELPSDANGDNTYRVALTARDPSLATGTVTLDIIVEDVIESSETVRLVDGLTDAVSLARIPAFTLDFVVAQKNGLIRYIDIDADTGVGVIRATDLLDLSAVVGTGANQGLLHIAFRSDSVLYVSLISPEGNFEIREYTLTSETNDDGDTVTTADPDSEQLIMQFAYPDSTENAGWIDFIGTTGVMLIATSDGGPASAATSPAQDTNSFLGKILRINVLTDDFTDDDNQNYSIPTDNPFTDGANGAPEVWALGLNNPASGFIETGTDADGNGFANLYIGDRGESLAEEISRADLFLDVSTDQDPQNFGWPVFEGTQANTGTTDDTLITPFVEYLHADNLGTGVLMGEIYDGLVDNLEGQLVFTDSTTQDFFSIAVDDIPTDGTTLQRPNSAIVDNSLLFTPDIGSIDGIVDYGPDGTEFYLLDNDGDVFKIQPDLD